MNHNCLVCDDEFDSDESLKIHLKSHLDESILNRPIEISSNSGSFEFTKRHINLKEIFSAETFEKQVKLKMDAINDNDEYLSRTTFIDQIKQVNEKNPFCYIPYFIEDFINGFSGTTLQTKYHVWDHMDISNIVKNILNFSEKRYTTPKFENATQLNLKIINWEKKYIEIINNCKFFQNELEELIFHNILQCQILILLMQSPLEKNEIYKKCREQKDHYILLKFMTPELVKVFEKFSDIGLDNNIDEIIFELKKQNIILRDNVDIKKLKVRFPIDEIKKYILHILKFEKNILYSQLRFQINEHFPGLRLVPGVGAFTTAWRELYKVDKLIHVEDRSRKPNDFVLFLNEDFQKLDVAVKSIDSNQNKIPFKGRKITPEKFVSELLELEKGEFDDQDDQVTRIAGLVLAESVALQSAPEKIKEFDFTMNLVDYRFRPDQLEAMAKLNFRVDSQIFHLKVMIDEILDLKTYENLKEKLPINEQCVVITFMKIPLNVKKIIENDSKIQVIDEEGIKTWVSITSKLPARVNSICKIYFDPLSKLENKLVKINSVFYEKGIALVTVFPELNEVTVLARSLEEIPLFELNPSNFNLISKNYLEFLKILTNCTLNDDLIDGFFKNKFTEDSTVSKSVFKLKFDYNIVNLNLTCYEKRDIFNCDCMKYAENPLRLCSHLVTTLDHIFRTYSYGDNFWHDSNRMKRGLENLLQENIEIILDRLDVTEEHGAIKDEHKVMDFISATIKIENNS
jgi:hypothetical protein